MGIHRDRLGAANVHRAFVDGARTALQKWASTKLGHAIALSAISPDTFAGVELLPVLAPPMLEEALGYRGDWRYVSFGYSPRTQKFGHCDGGDDIPTEPGTWFRFLRHPFVNPHLPDERYPTLYGVFGRERGSKFLVSPHCLLLDREKRQLYISCRSEAILFLLLTEPDEKEGRRVFIDNLRMSPGDQDYKVPPPEELSVGLVAWLDNRLRSERNMGLEIQ